MTELTNEERAAFIKRWTAETTAELLARDAPYSKPWCIKLGVRAGKRGITGMKWAKNNRSFYQVESIVKHHLCICPPGDEALFDDDDRSLSHVESDSSARRQLARLRGACGIATRDGARRCGPSFPFWRANSRSTNVSNSGIGACR